MTKRDLAVQVAYATGMSINTVEDIIDKTLSRVEVNVAKGETIYLRGFGTLGSKVRKAKVGQDINRKKSVVIPAQHIPFFKPSMLFSKKVKALDKI